MCLKSCLHSLKSRPIQVNVPQGCFHSLNSYSGLIILPTSGGYLKLINHIISDKRIQLLAGIPLCKSQELSQREHSTSRLCSIHHDIPVTMHTPAAYGQWSVFDHSGGNQSAVLGTRYGIWWPWYGSDSADNGPLTRYGKLQVAHAPGMPGTFPPAANFKGNR